MSLSMEVGMACPPSSGNEALRMEGNMRYRDSAVFPFQRFHCAVVLKYFLLKEEMTKSTAMSIADGLYAAQNSQNGLMSDPHYERIKECRRRRQQVDILLQYILHGTKETYICFVQLLANSGDEHIAKSLDENSPTDAQFQEFVQLQLSSLGNSPRPDCHCPRFVLQELQLQSLRYMLNDAPTTETIADFLLSRLFFAISEHKNIYTCPLRDEQRIDSLLHTMIRCSYKIHDALAEVLDILKMEHVLSYLYETRRDPNDEEMLEDNGMPKRLLDHQTERKIVETYQAGPMELNMKAFKAVSFEVERMEIGSILIRLRPVCKDSWQRFQEQCSSGEIKNFIASVYENENLEEGRYEIYVQIYKEASWFFNSGSRAIIHLKEKNEPEAKGGGQDIRRKLLEKRLDLKAPKTASWGKQENTFKQEGEQDIRRKLLEKRLDLKAPKTAWLLWRKQENTFKQEAGTVIRKENYIVRHMNLLCEEMDVSTSLLSYLSQHELLNEFIKEELKRKTGRAEKMRFLLTVLSDKENAEGILKQFIKKTDRCLFDDIESIENETNPVKEKEIVDESRKTHDQRYKIVYKLLANERAYVARLQLLIEAYHMRVVSENRTGMFMPPEVVAEIFLNIHSIYQLHHESVLPQLEKRMENWSQKDGIADIFLREIPILELYGKYRKHFYNAIDLITEWTSKSPKFASLLQEIQKPTECGQLTLQQRLFELKWRVSVYELHLKEYLKYLDTMSAENHLVEMALLGLRQAEEARVYEYEENIWMTADIDPFVMPEDPPPPRRLYFTAVAILIVKRNDSSRGKTVKENSSTKSDMQLWCPKLVDPVCYFEDEMDTKDDLPKRKKPRPTPPETGRTNFDIVF